MRKRLIDKKLSFRGRKGGGKASVVKETRLYPVWPKETFTNYKVLKKEGTFGGAMHFGRRGKQTIQLEEVYLEPELRHKGLGRKLLQKILWDAYRQGNKLARVYPTAESMPFYEKMGFRAIKTERRFGMPVLGLDLKEWAEKLKEKKGRQLGK